jgi:hypothetical protein
MQPAAVPKRRFNKGRSLILPWGLAAGAAAINIYINVMNLRIGGVGSFSLALNGALFAATCLACKQKNAWGAALVVWTSHCLFVSPFSFSLLVPGIMLCGALMLEFESLSCYLRQHLALICTLLFCYLGSELFYQGERASSFIESALTFLRFAMIFIAVPAFARVVARAKDVQEGVVVSVTLFAGYLLTIYLTSDRLVYGESNTEEISAAVGNQTITVVRTWMGPALACVSCAAFGQAFAARSLARSVPSFTLAAFALSVTMRIGSRGGTIAALAGMSIITVLSLFRKGRSAHRVLMALAVASAAYVLIFQSSQSIEAISKRTIEAEDNIGQVSARPDRWLWSLEQVCSAPMGVGYTQTPIGNISHAHNDILIVSMSYGAAAGIIVIALFSIKLRRLVKSAFSQGPRTAQALAGLGLLVTFGIASNIDMLLVVGFVFEWSWMLLCVLEEYSASTNAIEKIPNPMRLESSPPNLAG